MPFDWEKVSRNSDEYKACLAATTGVGGAAGLMVGAAGAPMTAGMSVPAVGAAGTALGFVTGFLACPYLAPKVKKKLMDGAELSDLEASHAARAMSNYALVGNTDNAVKLVAKVREMASASSGVAALARKNVPKTGNALINKAIPA